MSIPYTGKYTEYILGELFDGFNLWNLTDMEYVIQEWNEKNRKNGGYIEARVNYQDISQSKLIIRSIKKTKDE